MYTEEEVLIILKSHTQRVQRMVNNLPVEEFDMWWNQFKKPTNDEKQGNNT